MAIDTEGKGMNGTRDEYFDEAGLIDCLRRMAEGNDPDQAIQDLLAFLGEKCLGQRIYIFEKGENLTVSNAYEWCAPNVIAQKKLRPSESLEMIRRWWDRLERDQAVIINNVEDIKESDPQLYAALKSQDIEAWAAVSVRVKGEVTGFIGVDNPDVDKIPALARLLSGISCLVAQGLERRNLNALAGYSSGQRRPTVSGRSPEPADGQEDEALAQYLQNNYFDPILFFKALSLPDYYPYIGDLQSNLFYVSDEMRDVFGFSDNIVPDLVGEWASRIADPKDAELFREDMEQLLRGEKDVHDLYYRIRDKKGDDVWVHCHGLIKWDQDRTKPLFFSGGVAHQKKNFTVDAVTNLPKEYVALQKIRELQNQQIGLTVIGFTLNNFSEINELRGRHAADLFLGKIAKTLTKEFDNKLMFYRLDGMRFLAVVLPEGAESAEELIRQIRQTISDVYYGSNIMVQSPCSFALINENGDDTLPQDILVNIVALLTQAKNIPEKEYLTYSPQDVYSQKIKAQMMMELNKNVLDGFKNFRIAVQPVVSTKDMKVISGEVLLRWRYEGKDVSPTIFVPMLEDSRLILKVGQWVLEQAIRTCSRVLTYLPDFYLAVNASYYQIVDPEFLPFVETVLEKYHFSGRHLVLEMTETHYDEAPAKVRQFVENCRQLGIRVAIDDFGDGYASLAFLIKYPAAIVKLDRSLINEITGSEDNINFIASIVYACHRFGKKVCAEGVETKEELTLLKDSGCDLIQGYYFYRPLELNSFYELLPGK